eukprot:gene1641-4775_t
MDWLRTVQPTLDFNKEVITISPPTSRTRGTRGTRRTRKYKSSASAVTVSKPDNAIGQTQSTSSSLRKLDKDMDNRHD